jgi:hypothetical protein
MLVQQVKWSILTFVHEFVVDGVIKIVFVKTTENKSDMFTKNVSVEAYDDHIDNFIMDHKDITSNGWPAWEDDIITAVWAAAVLPCYVHVAWWNFTFTW